MIDWTGIARDLHYESPAEMWKDLYGKRGMSLITLSERFAVSQNSIRKALVASGVDIRSRGGPNNLKVPVTDELLQEVAEMGVLKTAEKHQVDPTTLYKKLYYRYGKKLREMKLEGMPTEVEPTPSEGDSHRDDNQ